jgi:hypothetical protein
MFPQHGPRANVVKLRLLTSEPPNKCSEVHDVHGRNETRSSYLENMFNRHLLPKFKLEVVDLNDWLFTGFRAHYTCR